VTPALPVILRRSRITADRQKKVTLARAWMSAVVPRHGRKSPLDLYKRRSEMQLERELKHAGVKGRGDRPESCCSEAPVGRS
jgi:hypothetical protein